MVIKYARSLYPIAVYAPDTISQLFLVDVVVDVDSLLPNIAPQLYEDLTRYAAHR